MYFVGVLEKGAFMNRFYLFVGIVGLIVLGGILLTAQDEKKDEKDLIVHEWGVIQFCKDKADIRAHSEEKDLPDFVHRWDDKDEKPPLDEKVCPRCKKPFDPWGNCECPDRPVQKKPILYFYTKDLSKTLNVKVEFLKGEPLYWWPDAEKKLDKGGYLEWKNVELLDPKDKADKNFQNPGYAQWVSVARDTDSCILKLKSLDGKTDLYERFLFYECTAEDYKSTLKVTAKEKGVAISGEGKEVIVVRVKDKKLELSYSEKVNEKNDKVVELKGAKVEDAMEQLIKVLKSTGLYEKEAKGMAKVWRKDFFEKEGVRAIYLMPQETYDKLCPLTITPKPKEVKRVILVQVEADKDK